MPEDSSRGPVSRKRFLESAALSAALHGTSVAQTTQETQKAEHNRSSSTPIEPDNPPLHSENPDSVVPPITDHGNIESFKFPFTRSRGV